MDKNDQEDGESRPRRATGEATNKRGPIIDIEAKPKQTGFEIVSTVSKHSPVALEKAGELIQRVNRGELTIAQAIARSDQPIVKVLEAYVDANEISPDLLRRVRRTRLNQAMLSDDVGVMFGAVKLLHDEDKIAPPEETGGLSDEIAEKGRLARKLLDEKQAQQAESDRKEIMKEDAD